jgi:hypothetical protein
MQNANHFIRCTGCGAEFRSLFSGSVSALGCVECCPSCNIAVNTPTLIGGYNFNSLQQAIQEPMIRQYGSAGSDGYVFMGKGELHFSINSPFLIPVHASYERNLYRALDLLDIYYEVATNRKQVVLSAIYISIMTAYECLTDDLLQTRTLPDFCGHSDLTENPSHGNPWTTKDQTL